MPDESIDCVVTSPPYWGLRDYGTAEWEGGDENCSHNPQKSDGGEREDRTLPLGRGGVYKSVCKCGAIRKDSQLGLEETPEEFVANLVKVFSEVKRVLKKEGSVWLNLGDSYAMSSMRGKNSEFKGAINQSKQGIVGIDKKIPIGLKPKDLVGIPWRVAFALQADGWYLRQDIIWHKPNPMPESVQDRCTKAHEYIFLLTKSPKYFYDAGAIKEKAVGGRWGGNKPMNINNSKDKKNIHNGLTRERDMKFEMRNKRSVWKIATKPYKEAHFATYPIELPTYCIKAGCPEKVCKKCKKPVIKESYRETERVKFRVGARKRYIQKSFSTSLQTISGSYIAESSGSYSILDVATGETMVPFSAYTSMSCDSKSNYFIQWLDGFAPDRAYKILYKIKYDDGQEQIYDNDFEFIVTR